MLRLCFFIASLLMVTSAHASYLQADLPSPTTQVELGSHIIIAGRGLEAGKTWLVAAHSQALAFIDRAHHGPVHLLTALDPERIEDYVATLENWGYRNIRIRETEFTAAELIDRLSEPTLIASIDFIGHDGAFLGLALEDENSNHRFYRSDVKRLAGRARFSPDAFIRLIGCNTGWYLAPYMAQVLGVPTKGTLTSADVQLLYGSTTSRAAWSYDEAGAKPRGTSVLRKNTVSFGTPKPCPSGGGCVRLKAINASYMGKHGLYAGALPFAKFFCGSVPPSDCFRRMALSIEYEVSVNPMLLSHPDAQISTFDAFAETLADQFCPPMADSTTSGGQRCRDTVIAALNGQTQLTPEFTTLSPARQLACSFTRCAFHVGRDEKGQSILLSDDTRPSTAFTDELAAYVAGFKMLRQ